MIRRNTIISFAAVTIVASAALIAGPLDPPTGPVTSTYKTIAEVEPRTAVNAANTPGDSDSRFKISQTGSYYLTGNIIGAIGKHGIEIAAPGVTLDLNGFDLVGVPGSLDGVSVVGAGLNSIAVINGSVRTWGGDGVDLATAIPINSRVESVHASGNTGTGILTTSGSTVTNCSASLNASNGILTGNGGAVTNCSATGNGAIGISTLGGCTVTNCAVYQNTGNGIQVGVNGTIADSSSFDNEGHGISASSGCVITGSTATSNTGTGIDASTGCVITDCAVRGNADGGVQTGTHSTLTNCSATSNTGSGISASAGSALNGCSAGSNSVVGYSTSTSCTLTNCAAYANQGDGILTSQGNTITNCSSFNNTGHGINVQTGCTVADCSVKFNTLDGIRFSSECLIRGNDVSYAGWLAGDGAAIHATSQLNRIEANHCNRSDRGIDVDGEGNVIIKNTCTANTVNFIFVAENVHGPILNRIAPGSPIVNGNTATSTLGSTDANANYAH